MGNNNYKGTLVIDTPSPPIAINKKANSFVEDLPDHAILSNILKFQTDIHFKINPTSKPFNEASERENQLMLHKTLGLMIEEVIEAIRELPQRKTELPKEMNPERVKSEVMDALQIGFSILGFMNVTAEEFIELWSGNLEGKHRRLDNGIH